MRAVIVVAFVTTFACGCRRSAPSGAESTATSTAVGIGPYSLTVFCMLEK